MSKEKDLDIQVTPLVEDCFYLLMAANNKISQEQGQKIFDRIKGKRTQQEYLDAINTAKRMMDNLEKYGVACAEWS